MNTVTSLKTVTKNAESLVEGALSKTGGLLRLAPNWVPRSFLQPGLRIKLHPDDTYAYGANRGGIDERWFASTTEAADEGRVPDEGLSYCVVGSERLSPRRASVQEEKPGNGEYALEALAENRTQNPMRTSTGGNRGSIACFVGIDGFLDGIMSAVQAAEAKGRRQEATDRASRHRQAQEQVWGWIASIAHPHLQGSAMKSLGDGPSLLPDLGTLALFPFAVAEYEFGPDDTWDSLLQYVDGLLENSPPALRASLSYELNKRFPRLEKQTHPPAYPVSQQAVRFSGYNAPGGKKLR